MQDDKYVVFKHSELNDAMILDRDLPDPVDDAVVIRKQDVFAAPALHTYAASIQTAIEILNLRRPDLSTEYDSKRFGALSDHLASVRDYFHEQAADADKWHKKVPD